MDIKELVTSYEENIIRDLKSLVAIPSIEGKPTPSMPFGEECAKALDNALKLGEALGFETKNLDNYCGYIQYGEGKDILGILCHVDVVPPGEGWSTDPFEGVLKDGKIYGRGTCDDKGPLVAALYAMKALKDMGIAPKKRIRLIVGANEETGSKCVEYYKKIEGDVDMGFSPDASFPLIFGEKGILRATYEFKNRCSSDVKLKSIAGGEAANVVCPKVICSLEGDEKALDSICANYKKYLSEKGLEGECTQNGNEVVLTLMGINAHASTPEEGVNAISYMVDFLKDEIESNFIDYVADNFALSWDLSKHNLACHDSYGSATCNLGVLKTQGDAITLVIDIRYPITMNFDPSIAILKETAEKAGAKFTLNSNSPPLFVDPKSPLVEALYKAYTTVSGDKKNQPITIGGGTYSRSFSNTVAFGSEMPFEQARMHMNDEYISVKNLLVSCEIFVEAIRNLLLI